MTTKAPTATRIDARNCTPARWDTPARGTVSWRTLISAGITPTDSLVCGLAEMQAGDSFALHSHPQAEVYFGIDGAGTVMIDGQPHHLAPGVALYIPGGAVHGVSSAQQPLKWFYTFAANSFDDIHYRFVHEAGETE